MKYIIQKTSVFGVALAGLLTVAMVNNAHAVAPANSTITNTASLLYTGLTTPITASVDVNVLLVPAAPTLAGGPGSGSVVPADNTVAEGQASTALYSLQASANGPDTYNLTTIGNATPSNITGAIAVSYKDAANAPITSILLGATSANADALAGAGSISVPNDGVVGGGLNGIANGSYVVIGANTYIVNVTDNGTGSDTLTLIGGTLPDGTAASTVLLANVPTGTLIAELKTFSMTIANVGVKTAAATPSFIDVVTTFTSLANVALTATDTHRSNLVQVTLENLVFNVTTPASNPAVGGVVIGGKTYFPTQATLVNAVSTETLEYVIRVTAPAGVPLTGAVLKDALPLFTTYVANSTLLNTKTVAGDGLTSPLVSVAGLAVDDDAPVRAAGVAATGNIAAGASAVVTFQVTVD